MARFTDRWGLSILGPGDSLSDNGYKFTDADIRLLDRLLSYAAEQHHHTGATGEDNTPPAGPNLTLLLTGGAIPSSQRYYYEFTVVDELGAESAPSPPALVDTPPSIVPPAAPALAYITGAGTLLPGNYSYALSAYKTANSLETKAVNSAIVTVPGTASTNEISMILPTLPAGADGLNVYRKSPSGMHYLYLTSIAAPTPGDAWVDDGSLTSDCDRSLPATNRTVNNNAIQVSFPGATPALPDGWSWRIYRADNPFDWARSYLTELTPQGATPTTPLSFIDLGAGTQVGGPPSLAQIINAPPKIDLTDGAEVTGTLPPGLITVPHVVTFTQGGPVTAGEGTFTWANDFDQADIIDCRAYLGVGSVPAEQAVIVDVNVYRSNDATPTWASIYEDGVTRPNIPVGQNVGVPAAPIIRHLAAGDVLTVDIDQVGGGDPATDINLTVNILIYIKDGSVTESYDWDS